MLTSDSLFFALIGLVTAALLFAGYRFGGPGRGTFSAALAGIVATAVANVGITVIYAIIAMLNYSGHCQKILQPRFECSMLEHVTNVSTIMAVGTTIFLPLFFVAFLAGFFVKRSRARFLPN